MRLVRWLISILENHEVVFILSPLKADAQST